MIIDCISDLHGFHPVLEGGDLLIVAGDCTSNDMISGWNEFFTWIDKQKYRKKIMIAGNHDNFCNQWAITGTFTNDEYDKMYPGEKPTIDYLCDSGTEFEGLKIYGSPWTKTFPGMNTRCKAFTLDTEEDLANKFSLIPDDIDILVTHSPPYGILDEVENYASGKIISVGSPSLRDIFVCRERMPKLKVHAFGHIHENGGKTFKTPFIKFINASHVNERYKPVNKPIRIIL